MCIGLYVYCFMFVRLVAESVIVGLKEKIQFTSDIRVLWFTLLGRERVLFAFMKKKRTLMNDNLFALYFSFSYTHVFF